MGGSKKEKRSLSEGGGSREQELSSTTIHHQHLGVVVRLRGLGLIGPAVGVASTALVGVKHRT